MDDYTNYASYQTINTMPHPEEKAWCISPKFQKSAQQVTVEMNNGKSYNYACKFPVAKGNVVVIGKQLQKDNIDSAWGVATTGSMGIASDIMPKLDIKRSHAAEIDFVFTQNVDKKLITACSKELELDTDSGILKSWSSSYIKAIYPISLLISKLISAASVIAFPEFASKDAIQKARDHICKPQVLDETIWSLTTMYPWYPDIYFCDIHIDVNGKNEEELNAVGVELTDGAIPGFDREGTPSDGINQGINKYVNKYVYMGAISIMARGGFANLLGAFLSANPPIGDFLDEIICAIEEHCCPEALALIIAAKNGDLTEENILKMTDAARKSKEVQCANGQIGNDNTHLKKESTKLEKVKETEEKKGQNRQENAAISKGKDAKESCSEKNKKDSVQAQEKEKTKSIISMPSDSPNKRGDFWISKEGVLKKYKGTSETVIIPDGVTEIEFDAFKNCLFVTSVSIPEGCEKIGFSLFSGCTQLESVALPSTLKELPSSAFEDTALTSVAIPEGCEEIGFGVFNGCTQLKSVTLPSTLRSIGESAFSETGIESIIIPEGIEVLEDSVFIQCESLKEVQLPNSLKEIKDLTFYGCEQLETIELPANLEKIGAEAFADSGLTSIDIPDGCKEVGNKCFDDCDDLYDIYVPASVKKVGDDAFATGTSLTDVHFESNILYGFDIDSDGVLKKYTGISSIVEIPDSVKQIDKYAFHKNLFAEKVIIPEGVESIDSFTFSDCTRITDITLPSTLRSIDEYAFSGSGLESIIIPEGIEVLEDGVFGQCESLKEVQLPNSLKEIKDDTFWKCERLETIELPASLEKIGTDAFAQSGLISVKIPDGCKEIGDGCFEYCEYLEDIYVPASLDKIGRNAFNTNNEGTNIHVVHGSLAEKANAITESISTKSSSTSSTIATPKATETKVSKSGCEIDYLDTLTAYNGNAKAIILPDGISAIGKKAFFGNENITSVVIPESVETIKDGAFWMCSNLETVILPSTIRSIGDNAFRSTMLTCIVIPDGCEALGADCFTDCEMLNDIYVPSSVYSIGEDAFCTFNDATVIHTEEYSTAESTAKENGIKVDYEAAPALSTLKETFSMGEASELADIMSDLTTQVDEMQSQELSNDDRETLSGIIDTLEGMKNDFAEGMGRYGDYLEQKEAREKAREEEKARKMAEAMANGKSEKDIVNMYIILTNEKKLGQLHRSQDNFFEIYEDDFAALSKAEVIQMRKDMLAEMEDESLCSYYAESFRQRSVKDRFTTSTLNLNNVSDEPDFGKKSEFAIENSKEWFTPAEYAEVRKLMDAELADARKQIDEQLRAIEENWMKFNTATEFLQICIEEKSADGSDMQESCSCFQHVIGSALVSIKLSTKGILKMVTNVMNFYPWYWGVTVRDIWVAARRNEIDDKREGAYNGNQIADQALNYIMSKYKAPQEDYEDAMRLATASYGNQVSWAIDRFEKMGSFKYSNEISWCKKRIELLNEKKDLKRQIDDPEYRVNNTPKLKELDKEIASVNGQINNLNSQIHKINNSISSLNEEEEDERLNRAFGILFMIFGLLEFYCAITTDSILGKILFYPFSILTLLEGLRSLSPSKKSANDKQTNAEDESQNRKGEKELQQEELERCQTNLAEKQARYEALLKERRDTADRIRNMKGSSEMLEIHEKIKLIDEKLSKSFEEAMQ